MEEEDLSLSLLGDDVLFTAANELDIPEEDLLRMSPTASSSDKSLQSTSSSSDLLLHNLFAEAPPEWAVSADIPFQPDEESPNELDWTMRFTRELEERDYGQGSSKGSDSWKDGLSSSSSSSTIWSSVSPSTYASSSTAMSGPSKSQGTSTTRTMSRDHGKKDSLRRLLRNEETPPKIRITEVIDLTGDSDGSPGAPQSDVHPPPPALSPATQSGQEFGILDQKQPPTLRLEQLLQPPQPAELKTKRRSRRTRSSIGDGQKQMDLPKGPSPQRGIVKSGDYYEESNDQGQSLIDLFSDPRINSLKSYLSMERDNCPPSTSSANSAVEAPKKRRRKTERRRRRKDEEREYYESPVASKLPDEGAEMSANQQARKMKGGNDGSDQASTPTVQLSTTSTPNPQTQALPPQRPLARMQALSQAQVQRNRTVSRSSSAQHRAIPISVIGIKPQSTAFVHHLLTHSSRPLETPTRPTRSARSTSVPYQVAIHQLLPVFPTTPSPSPAAQTTPMAVPIQSPTSQPTPSRQLHISVPPAQQAPSVVSSQLAVPMSSHTTSTSFSRSTSARPPALPNQPAETFAFSPATAMAVIQARTTGRPVPDQGIMQQSISTQPSSVIRTKEERDAMLKALMDGRVPEMPQQAAKRGDHLDTGRAPQEQLPVERQEVPETSTVIPNQLRSGDITQEQSGTHLQSSELKLQEGQLVRGELGDLAGTQMPQQAQPTTGSLLPPTGRPSEVRFPVRQAKQSQQYDLHQPAYGHPNASSDHSQSHSQYPIRTSIGSQQPSQHSIDFARHPQSLHGYSNHTSQSLTGHSQWNQYAVPINAAPLPPISSLVPAYQTGQTPLYSQQQSFNGMANGQGQSSSGGYQGMHGQNGQHYPYARPAHSRASQPIRHSLNANPPPDSSLDAKFVEEKNRINSLIDKYRGIIKYERLMEENRDIIMNPAYSLSAPEEENGVEQGATDSTEMEEALDTVADFLKGEQEGNASVASPKRKSTSPREEGRARKRQRYITISDDMDNVNGDATTSSMMNDAQNAPRPLPSPTVSYRKEHDHEAHSNEVYKDDEQ